MKISTFMISMVLVGLFTSVFLSWYGEIGIKYSQNIDTSTNESLRAYNKLTQIQTLTSDINQTLFKVNSGDSGTFDLVSTFLGAGFNVLRSTGSTLTSFYEIAQLATTSLGLPAIFLDAIITIVLILVLFIIIRVLVGQEV